jgi:hypothetical protein
VRDKVERVERSMIIIVFCIVLCIDTDTDMGVLERFMGYCRPLVFAETGEDNMSAGFFYTA